MCTFLVGSALGGLMTHLWWRRWNRRRRIKIDTDGEDYIEIHDTKAAGGDYQVNL